jgi:SH3-like domain-containing protein
MSPRLILPLLALPLIAAAPEPPSRPVPYWASITAGQARMRTGPGRQFPAIWLYQRAGLPVKVVQVVSGWRRVQDQDGAVGWMLVNLLGDTRTAVVTGGTKPLRSQPQADAPVVWQAEAGVVGRISKCGGGWCAFDAGGKKGFIAIGDVWGIGPVEVLE